MSLVERDASRKRIFTVLACFGAVIFFTNLALITGTDFGLRIEKMPLPEILGGKPKNSESGDLVDTLPKFADILDDLNFDKSHEAVDNHPIVGLMAEAAQRFREYDTGRSKTFAQAVKKYRAQYGRHPPPGFDKWYIFARERGIYHLDDFDQIMSDLRPFFSIPPSDLRVLIRGMITEDPGPSGLAALSVKAGKVTIINSSDNWRAQNLQKLLSVFSEHLPDMEIAMNRQDQPRVIATWETVQDALHVEETTRIMPIDVTNEFTPRPPISESVALPTAEWFRAPRKPYMDLAAGACPPASYARNNATMDPELAEATYKLSSGLVSNFNLSSDLCTAGPSIAEQHGFLFSASTIVATRKLVPVFGECKVNVNNDILFPANMYYAKDPRHDYDGHKDSAWEDKKNRLFWRGITSGGVQTKDNWRRLHRHRLVLLTNSTTLAASHETHPILTYSPNDPTKSYTSIPDFAPAAFAKQYTDVGFPELKWCVPDDECGWLKEYFTTVPETSLADQFVNKYLVDIDGHSFSGRWHAFLKSRSMGIKATIFREWHDSRLFAWLHFVPMDNRFDDLYSLLTYFIGLSSTSTTADESGPRAPYVPSHDFEAKMLANAGRDWAGKVLRREDIEIYMYRLMLEYARLLDDSRDRIGYGGDGSEMDEKWSW